MNSEDNSADMQGKLTWQKTILWVFLYSIGMAFLESAVVIYLRAIYYPDGFDFPLAPADKYIALTEAGREAGTLLMLLAIGFIAGRSRIQRFAYFILSFAIWDIFYYIFLRIIIGWPGSLMTLDVLFLIPTTWVGPVITPILISLTMIVLALMIIVNEGKGRLVRFSIPVWIILICGSLVLILAFIWDYSAYILEHHTFAQLFNPAHSDAISDTAYQYIPRSFNWFLFILGEVIILSGIVIGFRKNE